MSGTFRTLTPFGIGCSFIGGRNPLVNIAVADPDGVVAVEVDGGPVLCVPFTRRTTRHCRAYPGTRNGFVHRQEEVSTGAGGKQVVELDANRLRIPRISR